MKKRDFLRTIIGGSIFIPAIVTSEPSLPAPPSVVHEADRFSPLELAGLFKELNVVDFKRAEKDTKLQLFRDTYFSPAPDDNFIINRYHVKSISIAVVNSKEHTLTTSNGYPVYCFQGFIERYGRAPVKEDRIRILYGDKFFYRERRGGQITLTSELNFELI